MAYGHSMQTRGEYSKLPTGKAAATRAIQGPLHLDRADWFKSAVWPFASCLRWTACWLQMDSISVLLNNDSARHVQWSIFNLPQGRQWQCGKTKMDRCYETTILPSTHHRNLRLCYAIDGTYQDTLQHKAHEQYWFICSLSSNSILAISHLFTE